MSRSAGRSAGTALTLGEGARGDPLGQRDSMRRITERG